MASTVKNGIACLRKGNRRRRRQGRRPEKNEFIFYRRISHMPRSVQCVYRLSAPPDMKGNTFLRMKKLFSFVQCFRKAICRNYFWAGPHCKIRTAKGTNQNSPFRHEPICVIK